MAVFKGFLLPVDFLEGQVQPIDIPKTSSAINFPGFSHVQFTMRIKSSLAVQGEPYKCHHGVIVMGT
jgi:hypothetical protein